MADGLRTITRTGNPTIQTIWDTHFTEGPLLCAPVTMSNVAWIVIGGLAFLLGISDLWLEGIFFDQHDRPLVPLEEELSVVSAYLEIESMRLPGQLEVVQNVDSRGLHALIPSFALQGLVENALEHGNRIADVCRVDITVRVKDERLEMTVTDNGMGIPGTEIQEVFFPERSQPGRLTLLRWQLGELFGKSFKFEIDSEIGAGTTAKLSIPLQIHSAASRRT